MLIRRRVIFSGRVQGVFFRATSAELARGLKLAGYVRNLADGSVELEAQGSAEQIDALLRAIHEHYRGNISGQRVTDVAVEPDAGGFEIQR